MQEIPNRDCHKSGNDLFIVYHFISNLIMPLTHAAAEYSSAQRTDLKKKTTFSQEGRVRESKRVRGKKEREKEREMERKMKRRKEREKERK